MQQPHFCLTFFEPAPNRSSSELSSSNKEVEGLALDGRDLWRAGICLEGIGFVTVVILGGF